MVCGYRFQYKKRSQRLGSKLWDDYVSGKQTLVELSMRYKKSHVTIRNHMDSLVVPNTPSLTPQPTVIIADTTFWGRHYGVVVFRSWNLRRNIWWQEVTSEKQAHYLYGRQILEERGWTFTAAVIDGRRGLTTVFKDIPVQMCQFHQLKTVTKYLTRNPKTDAGKTLRALVLTLTKTDEKAFTEALTRWEKTWHSFYTQKTYRPDGTGWHYTHKNVRSAYRSLKKNLPYLFTCQTHKHLNIPNTTNSIDGCFASLKKKVAAHHGLRRDRRYKMISELLSKG